MADDPASGDRTPLLSANDMSSYTSVSVHNHTALFPPASHTSSHDRDPHMADLPPPPYSETQASAHQGNSLTVGVDEMPPPYSPTAPGTSPVINCKVCQTAISLEGKQHLHVVKCNRCGEATPIRAPPPGKKYIRCPCNLLLVCRSGATKILCPRESCKRVINLPGPPSHPVVGRRFQCAYCHNEFVLRMAFMFARCPHCRRASVVVEGYGRRRAAIYLVIGLVFLFAATGITVGTYEMASQSGGFYVAWIGGFLVGIIFILRALHFYCIRTSRPVEGTHTV